MNNVLIYSLIKKLSIRIDRLISSSQDSNPNIALGNLSNKIDTLKQNVDTKAKQETVNKVGRDLENIGSILSNKVDKVEKAINTKASQSSVTEVWQDVNNMMSKLGTIEGKVDNKASQEDMRDIDNDLMKIINKVQRGAVNRVMRGRLGGGNGNRLETNLMDKDNDGGTISYIDVTLPYTISRLDKAIAGCEFAMEASNGSSIAAYNIACQLIDASTLRIYVRHSRYLDLITWQVIEYY